MWEIKSFKENFVMEANEGNVWQYFAGAVEKKFTCFTGRARRKEFWFFMLFYACFTLGPLVIQGICNAFILAFAAIIYAAGISFINFSYLSLTSISMIAIAVLFLPALGVSIRRAHDTGKCGWFVLIPVYGLIIMFFEGDKQSNKYGNDPKA